MKRLEVEFMEKKIYVVRHCEAVGQGYALTERSKRRARDLTFFTNIKIDWVVSSPMLRAVQSVGPITEQKSLIVEEDERLTESILSTKMLLDWLEKLEASFEDIDVAYDSGESS